MINSASVGSSVAQGKERLVLELTSPFLRLGKKSIKTMKLIKESPNELKKKKKRDTWV